MLAPRAVDNVPKEKLEITMLFGLEGSTATEGSLPQSLYARVPYPEPVNSESGRLPITSTGALTIRLAEASEAGSTPRRTRIISERAVIELILLPVVDDPTSSACASGHYMVKRQRLGAPRSLFDPRVYHRTSHGHRSR